MVHVKLDYQRFGKVLNAVSRPCKYLTPDGSHKAPCDMCALEYCDCPCPTCKNLPKPWPTNWPCCNGLNRTPRDDINLNELLPAMADPWGPVVLYVLSDHSEFSLAGLTPEPDCVAGHCCLTVEAPTPLEAARFGCALALKREFTIEGAK